MSQERRLKTNDTSPPSPSPLGGSVGRRLSLVPSSAGRWDGWEIVGRVKSATLARRKNYRVQGTVLLEVKEATRKNRTVLFYLWSNATYAVVEKAIRDGAEIVARGVFDTGVVGSRFVVKLRATEVETYRDKAPTVDPTLAKISAEYLTEQAVPMMGTIEEQIRRARNLPTMAAIQGAAQGGWAGQPATSAELKARILRAAPGCEEWLNALIRAAEQETLDYYGIVTTTPKARATDGTPPAAP